MKKDKLIQNALQAFGLLLVATIILIIYFPKNSEIEKSPDVLVKKASPDLEKNLKASSEELPLIYAYNPPRRASHIDYVSYKNALGYKESSDNYDAVNSLGYVGRYQIGIAMCKDLGTTRKELLESKTLQDKALLASLKINKWRCRKYISKYNNALIKGIVVTESGILAGAHLVGHGNVKKWLRSRGKVNPRDANGMGVEEYVRDFSGFNFNIKAEKSVKL
jgi:hypothetical protein